MTTCKKNREQHKTTCPAYFKPLLPEILVGKCCECVKFHRDNKQIPPCFFTEKQIQESTNFSIERFVELNHICTCKRVVPHSKSRASEILEDIMKNYC